MGVLLQLHVLFVILYSSINIHCFRDELIFYVIYYEYCILQVPNEDERAEIMDGLLQNVSYSGDLSGQYLAQRTAVGSLVLFPYVTCTGNGT